MHYLSSILAVFILSIQGSIASSPPWYYHGLDGPIFKNTTVDNDIQVRDYQAALWASTVVEGTQLNVAENVGFQRLFDYISGENELGIPIDMTTPVLTHVKPGSGPNCNSTFTVSFFVPFEYQTAEGPPKPTSSLVYIESIGPLQVGVSEFDGYAIQAEIVVRTAALEKDIEKSEDVEVDTSSSSIEDTWWFAGYDPPFRVSNRHNEVWVPVISTTTTTKIKRSFLGH